MGEKEGKRRRRKREERLEGKPKRRGDHWTRRRETSWESLLLILAMTDESAGTIASTNRSRDASQETRKTGVMGPEGDSTEPLAVSLWELRVVFTVGRSVIYSRERNESEKEEGREEEGKKIGESSVTFPTRFTQPNTMSVRCRALRYERVVTRRACFGAEATVASAGSRRRRAGTTS